MPLNNHDNPNGKAAAYLRVSTQKQSETSLETQLDHIQAFAAKLNIEIVEIFREKVTASGKKERPCFEKMIENAKEGKYNFILVYKMDRFSRNNSQGLKAIEELKNKNVFLLSATEPVNDDTAASELMKNILSAINQFYISNNSQEVYDKTTKVAEKGYFLGGIPPFGFDIESVRDPEAIRVRKKYKINEKEAFIVKLIFKLYSEHKSYGYVVKYLNDKGYKTRKGKSWSKQTLYDMLRNEKYKGTFVFRKGKKYNYHAKRDDTIRVDNILPVIVEEELFNKVQDILKSKSVTRIKKPGLYLLQGIIYCGDCGSKMYANRNKGCHQYICSRYQNYHDVDFVGMGIKKVEEQVLGYVKAKFTLDNIDIHSLTRKINQQNFDRNTFLKQKLEELQEERMNLLKQIDNALKAILDNSPLKDELEREVPKFKESLEEIESEIASIKNHTKQFITEEELKEKLIYISNMINGDFEMQRKILPTLIEKVIIHKSKYIEIIEVK